MSKETELMDELVEVNKELETLQNQLASKRLHQARLKRELDAL